ncbi:MAG: transketolase, partial [Synergistaceae bacterium]|nr:transketolase [Synergistaceae bacterium]
MEIVELERIAKKTRQDIARMFHRSGSGHFGGSFSCVEIVTFLYFEVMNIKVDDLAWTGRDRFIISKGHGAAAVYATLMQLGVIPKKWIEMYETLDANLSTHPNHRKIPGFDMSAGSLGHGLSVGVGMAMAAKMDGASYNTYVLLGDGEQNEGAVWEAAMCAHKY